MEPLGSGGMADVFLAHDNVLDRKVALKVMSGRYASDDEFVERFRREAQSAAALSHPNIVSIYDRGESKDGTYYIAMEYLSGGTLKDRIVKKGAIPAKTAAAVAAQIAEALKVAHDRGVVHRDIKPHNILITEGGDIKVTDFGIARAASSSTMTKTGAVMGTAHYISPEQAMGESVGPASDLYSLGVLLYEMLTGQLPYDADTPIGIAMKHVNGQLRPPREVNPNVPAGMNAIAVKLLQKDPEHRYASDQELIDDLERASRGESPTSAAATQVMNRAGKTDGTQVMPPVPPRQSEKKNRWRKLVPLILLGLLLLALLGFAGYNLLSSEPETPRVNVPDLTGLTLEEARAEAGNNLTVVEGDTEDGPDEAGIVLDQDPSSGGGQVDEGSEIEVTVSSGQNDVPNVLGGERGEAEQALSDEGFEVEVETAESDEEDVGQVIDQSPSGGSTEDVGSAVVITVGSGPNLVAVPDIPVGTSESQASSQLESAGLSLGSVSETESSDVAEGGVVAQDPLPGTEVEEGTSVSVTLSSGPPQVEVPNVVGSDITSAAQTMLNAGLGYQPAGIESSEAVNTVISTNPSAGTSLEAGSADSIVTITYSLDEAEEVPEPTVEEPTTAPAQPDNNDSNNDGSNNNDSNNNDSNDDGSNNNGPANQSPAPSAPQNGGANTPGGSGSGPNDNDNDDD